MEGQSTDDLRQTLEEYKTQQEQVRPHTVAHNLQLPCPRSWVLSVLLSQIDEMQGKRHADYLIVPSVEAKIVCAQVEQLLLSEPNNQEYEDIYHSLTEAISLTEELLKESDFGAATGQGFLSHLALWSKTTVLLCRAHICKNLRTPVNLDSSWHPTANDGQWWLEQLQDTLVH